MSKPELHFAHANGIPSACYAKFLEALDETFDIHSVPVLGTDPNYPVDDNWDSLVEQVADSIRVRCNSPVIGVGHSLGGLTTFMAAHRYPELFRAVVIMDPPIINGLGAFSFGLMKAIGQVDRVTPAGKSKGRREVWPSREVAHELLGKKRLFRSFDPDCFEDYIRFALKECNDGVCLTIPAAVEVNIFRHTPHNAWHYRRPLNVPSVLLSGATSEFRGTGFSERMARTHHMLHSYVEGGHMFPLEHPLQTAAQVLTSLRQRQVIV
jgi:pimeloyl-ACP methyl ester carboxylesterase